MLSRRRARPAAAKAVAGLLVATAVSGCGGGGGRPTAPATASPDRSTAGAAPTDTAGTEVIPVADLVDGMKAVCRAAGEATSGDVRAARADFFDHSHEAVHELARAVEHADRAAVARLLEAKEAVEVDLGHDPPAVTLAADLYRLSEAGAAGLTRLAIQAPPCKK